MRHLLIATSALIPSFVVSSVAMADLKVVASFSILGDITSEIGGDLISVKTIVGAGQDAHVYSPSIADAQAVAAADLILFIGLGFEGFADDLVSASGTEAVRITVTDSLPLDLHEEEEHHGEEHDEHGHEDHSDEHDKHGHGDEHEDHEDHKEDAADFHAHDHGEVDPHAWGAVANVVAFAETIAEELGKLDPDNAVTYAQTAEAYVTELLAAKASFTVRIEALPADHRTVVTTHDAFGYLAEETGLTFLAAKGVTTGSAASASSVFGLIEQLNSLPHAALFVEGIENPALIQQIADETGYEVGGALYSDALSGPEGPAATYLDMYTYNMESILSALEDH